MNKQKIKLSGAVCPELSPFWAKPLKWYIRRRDKENISPCHESISHPDNPDDIIRAGSLDFHMKLLSCNRRRYTTA